MKSYSSLTQSRFFTPAFNSAIFDGPIRIYFAQFHESAALKIYFLIHEQHQDLLERAKEISKQTGQNIFVMLYPTQENFEMSFEGKFKREHPICLDRLHQDVVIGLNGVLADTDLVYIVEAIQTIIKDWEYAEAETVLM